jgi:hypothetical protein
MRQEREGGSEDKETKQESARAREREREREREKRHDSYLCPSNIMMMLLYPLLNEQLLSTLRWMLCLFVSGTRKFVVEVAGLM